MMRLGHYDAGVRHTWQKEIIYGVLAIGFILTNKWFGVCVVTLLFAAYYVLCFCCCQINSRHPENSRKISVVFVVDSLALIVRIPIP